MSEAIIIAVITGIFAVAGQLIISRQTSREMYSKLDKSQAVTDTKIEQLTHEVRQHNGFAEKIPRLEERINFLSERIDGLEKSANKGGAHA